jgi:hypothetical protein
VLRDAAFYIFGIESGDITFFLKAGDTYLPSSRTITLCLVSCRYGIHLKYSAFLTKYFSFGLHV